MDGVTVSAKNLRAPIVSVKVEGEGIYISAKDERDPTMWVFVHMTTAALWCIINHQADGPEFFLPPVPPFYADEMPLGTVPPVPACGDLPPVPPLGTVPPLPPKG